MRFKQNRVVKKVPVDFRVMSSLKTTLNITTMQSCSLSSATPSRLWVRKSPTAPKTCWEKGVTQFLSGPIHHAKRIVTVDLDCEALLSVGPCCSSKGIRIFLRREFGHVLKDRLLLFHPLDKFLGKALCEGSVLECITAKRAVRIIVTRASDADSLEGAIRARISLHY